MNDGNTPQPGDKLISPNTGTTVFGYIHETKSSGDTLPAGPIVLKRGKPKKTNSYGQLHIWAKHGTALHKLGYTSEEDIIRYVAEIIQPGSPVHCTFEHMGNKQRATVLRSAKHVAILEYKGTEYSVVTAYPSRNAHGTLVTRVKEKPKDGQ